MKTYYIKVTETLNKIVEVHAEKRTRGFAKSRRFVLQRRIRTRLQ